MTNIGNGNWHNRIGCLAAGFFLNEANDSRGDLS